MRPLKAGEITKTLTGTRQFRLKELPGFNFREITALEEGCGARSSFYFLALAAKKQQLEAVLGRPVVGYLSRAGFCCEATIGYADGIGFRGGMCHPFKVYDLKAGREIDILEIPLAVMDRTSDGYMRLDAGKTWELTRCLIDTTERSLPWGVHPFSGMIPA
ncbi:hypothetical protein L21_2137 [Methanoculleus chikugoensis]|uniref:Uncharacterized protein n=1 Tax=Methanoculleus chikugoensis TaxID=118126 RepID=A0A1M4MMR5_9EURY|nr:hypothetical protein [Methanoculleus chikugoensis]SCL76215.1 hypothetical protein L21_2137 [Methanoculleus chikugoensis]